MSEIDRASRLYQLAQYHEAVSGQLRSDGYANMLNKVGTSQDNSTAWEYRADSYVNDIELVKLYESNGLFSRIIDRPSEDCLSKGIDLTDLGEEIETEVQKRLSTLKWTSTAIKAEKWSRLFGGAIAVMLIDDGRGIDEPLDWKNIRSIEEIRVFERAIVQPDYMSQYQFAFYDDFEAQERPFGQPEYYCVYSVYGQFRVHYTRCLIFKNGEHPEFASNDYYRFWGIPEYVKLRESLRETVTTHQNGSKLLERSVLGIYKMKDLSSVLSTDEGEEKVIKRLEIIDMARHILNSLAIDNDGEDYNYINAQLAGVKDIIDSTCNMLSAVTEIPQSILFGRSPAGMDATGDNDMDNYEHLLNRIQSQSLKDNTEKLVKIILIQLIKEGRMEKDLPEYEIRFNPFKQMSELDTATIEQTKAATNQTKAQTAQVYVDMGALDPTEVRKALADSDDYQIQGLVEEDSDEVLELPDNALPQPSNEVFSAQNESTLPTEQVKTNTENDENDGGEGSGFHGHSGRKEKIGGSEKGNGGNDKYSNAASNQVFIDEDGQMWQKIDADTFASLETNEIANSEDMKSWGSEPCYFEGKTDREYAKDIPMEVWNAKKSEFIKNEMKQTGTVNLMDDDIGDMVNAVRHYGIGEECQKILATQDPDSYEMFELTDKQKEDYGKEADRIEKFIQFSDKFEKPIYRGMSFNTSVNGEQAEKILNSLKEGNTIGMGHIASWSKNEGTARSYSNGVLDMEIEDGENISILYKLKKPKTAVSISDINPEGEVISPKDAQYVVKSVKKKYNESSEITEYEVELAEVKPSNNRGGTTGIGNIGNSYNNSGPNGNNSSEENVGFKGKFEPGKVPVDSHGKTYEMVTADITDKERAKVTHDINNDFHAKFSEKRRAIITTYSNEQNSPAYAYSFEIHEFDEYNIYDKQLDEN